jgi:uncharacterized protein YukE
MNAAFQQEVEQLCINVAQLRQEVEQMAQLYADLDLSMRELSWYLGISVAVVALLFIPWTLELVGVF